MATRLELNQKTKENKIDIELSRTEAAWLLLQSSKDCTSIVAAKLFNKTKEAVCDSGYTIKFDGTKYKVGK